MSSSADYWRRREEAQRAHNITDEREYAREINRIYESMLNSIEEQINSFYAKYASAEGITMAEARKRAASLDIERYARKAERYVDERNFSAKANEEMRLYNLTMKVNRLELLKANIGLELVSGHDELERFMEEKIGDATEDELRRQAGILGKTVINNAKTAHVIVNASFHNATFSDRIWMHQDLLRNDINSLIQVGLIQGKNPRVLARELRKKFKVKKSDAERLMRTEMARARTDAQMREYEENGFGEYKYIACGGADVCDVCKKMDGRVFSVKKIMPGVNAPPMHPNCHCSTAPYIDEKKYYEWLDSYDQHHMSYNDWVEWNNVAEQREKIIQSNKNVRIPETAKKAIREAFQYINEAKKNKAEFSKEDKIFIRTELTKYFPERTFIGINPFTNRKIYVYGKDFSYFISVHGLDNSLRYEDLANITTVLDYDMALVSENEDTYSFIKKADKRDGFYDAILKRDGNDDEIFHFNYKGLKSTRKNVKSLKKKRKMKIIDVRSKKFVDMIDKK